MTLTEAKIQANQANARLSTGPRTEAGKAISSRNSMSHGLTAKTVLLPGEDPAEYDVLAAGILKELNPATTLEGSLAQELVDLQWRLRRISGLETRILSADSPDYKALNNISLHAARTKRQFSATLKEFQPLHEANNTRWNERLDDALKLHQADQRLERQSTVAQHGFDFTTEYLQSVLDRRKALKEATGTLSPRTSSPYVDDCDPYDEYLASLKEGEEDEFDFEEQAEYDREAEEDAA